MKNGKYYGIDFGTTNTSVCLYQYDSKYGVQEAKFGTDGKDIMPFSSCIAIPKTDLKNIIFGREVRENINQLSDDYKIVASFKSLLGTKEEFVVNDRHYNGVKLTALFLDYIKKTVNRSDFTEAIFSIPVDFTSEARKDLLKAAEYAGIKVKGFISESSSAYISKMKNIKAFSKVMVIDWGGGTLDLSILNISENKIYEEAVYGVKFGGDDIDRELAHRIQPKIYSDSSFDDLASVRKDRLMRNVEQMKIEFSTDDNDYEMICGPGSKPATIEYDTFAEIITPLITEHVLKAIGKIMYKVNVTPDGIDAVILAGGSSGLRPFADAIIAMFGEDKIIFDDENNGYQWMVARGAAITSAIECEFRLNDDICILLSDNDIYPILEKNKNKVGDKSDTLTFSLTDDSTDAHFIFTDSSGKKYTTLNVRTKGYFNEMLTLSAEIGKDQIAKVTVSNPNISPDYHETVEINQLRFYYDLSDIED